MNLSAWAAFAIASLIMAAIPGPGVASIIGFAFSSGRRTALASVAGMAVGNATAISVSLAGAGAILASSAFAFSVLKWAGAAYLIGMGIFVLARSGGAAKPHVSRRFISPRAAFLTNIAVGTFHPKTIIFFIAFASQFISPTDPYLPQAAILVVTFTVIAAATDTAYAMLASRASSLLETPRFRTWAQRAGGGALIAAGIATAAVRR